MGQKNSHDPKPGDLIEIKRGGYQHWALYVGDGYVIHVTAVNPSFSIGSARGEKAIVKKELLEKVVKNNKWSVNNKRDRSWNPLPVEEIIKDAERWIDVEVPYDLLDFNCEHFVTMLRYGVGDSDQVLIARGICRPGTVSVPLKGATGPLLIRASPVVAAAAIVNANARTLLCTALHCYLSLYLAQCQARKKLNKKEQKMLL